MRQVICEDHCFPQLLLLVESHYDAADKVYAAIVQADPGERRLKPILQPYDTIGSSRYVDFDTTRPVYATAPDSCQVSHVVMDSSWEGKVAEVVENAEDMPEVVSYAKNQGLGFYIPYTINGEQHRYLPDFIIAGHRQRGGDQSHPRSVRPGDQGERGQQLPPATCGSRPSTTTGPSASGAS